MNNKVDPDKLRQSILDRIENPHYVAYEGASEDIEQIHKVILTNPFVIRRQRRNKFLNRLPPNIKITVMNRTEQDKIKDKTVDVLEVDDKVAAQVADAMFTTIATIRDKLVSEFAPLSLSIDTAVNESVQVLNLITDAGVKASSFKAIKDMYNDLLMLKFMEFAAHTLKVDKGVLSEYRDHHLRKIEQQIANKGAGGSAGGQPNWSQALTQMATTLAQHKSGTPTVTAASRK